MPYRMGKLPLLFHIENYSSRIDNPPKIRKTIPDVGRTENSFPETKIISHPIARYRLIDQNFVPDPPAKIFKIVPKIASPQTIPKTTHAVVSVAERIGTSINGV